MCGTNVTKYTVLASSTEERNEIDAMLTSNYINTFSYKAIFISLENKSFSKSLINGIIFLNQNYLGLSHCWI